MPVEHDKTIIELKNVSFAYNGEKVLENINLPIHRGDYLGVIGPNGGGKTTVLKLMVGLLKPTTGLVQLFGTNVSNFKDWAKIGYVPQHSYFDSNFPATVKEVVAMGLYGKKGFLTFLTKKDKLKVADTLKKVEMSAFSDRLIGDLSGGQQQRVFIARALVSDPEVIFLDEPTVGVDVQTQEKFYQLLEKLNREMDLTLVLVSHDIDVITSEATELACINKELIYHGTPKEFIKSDYLENLYGKDIKFILHGH